MLPDDRHSVVAIDGPAASGKSSVARLLAQRLGFVYVNSGAMYRAVTWFILQRGIDPSDAGRITSEVRHAAITCDLQQNESRILINGVDPAPFLREDRVNNSVSAVSSVPDVREILVTKMRDYAKHHNLVMEGRDIGSVVFPETPFKFYIYAAPEVRLQRRVAQGERDQIAARDQADSSRPTAPLVIAGDAQVIDTSHISLDDVVTEILKRLKTQGALGQPTLSERQSSKALE